MNETKEGKESPSRGKWRSNLNIIANPFIFFQLPWFLPTLHTPPPHKHAKTPPRRKKSLRPARAPAGQERGHLLFVLLQILLQVPGVELEAERGGPDVRGVQGGKVPLGRGLVLQEGLAPRGDALRDGGQPEREHVEEALLVCWGSVVG